MGEPPDIMRTVPNPQKPVATVARRRCSEPGFVPPEKAASEGHIPSLDGIRGLAILLVMGGHLFGTKATSPNHWAQMLLSLRGLNWVGVNLFFALSGFLITSILFDTVGRRRYFRNFFGRRALRIFPLYYGVLFLLLALTPALHLHWNGTAIIFLTYTQNLPFRANPIGPAPWVVLRHFWSLAVEEQFYLVWPVLIFWLRSWRRVMGAAIIGSVLALVFRTALALAGGFPQNHSTPFCMDGLLLGGVLALLLRSPYRDVTLRYGRVVFAGACLCIVPFALARPDFYWETSFYLTSIGLTIVNIGAAGLIADALRPQSTSARLFSAGWLRFFGKYSYGLYVFHLSIGAFVGDVINSPLHARGIPQSVGNIVGGLLATVLSIVVSMASYHLYEVHFLGLKRFFSSSKETTLVGSTA